MRCTIAIEHLQKRRLPTGLHNDCGTRAASIRDEQPITGREGRNNYRSNDRVMLASKILASRSLLETVEVLETMPFDEFVTLGLLEIFLHHINHQILERCLRNPTEFFASFGRVT
jgi:hypothetical protein